MEHIITQIGYSKDDYAHLGNQFLVGNGYMGIRGTLCEYGKEYLPAINLAGLYDQVGDKWRESVNAPNGLFAYILVNGERCMLPETTCVNHRQMLDIEKGALSRRTVYPIADGSVCFSEERMASMSNQRLILQALTVKSDTSADIDVVCGIDGDVWDINGPHLEQIFGYEAKGILTMEARTHEKGIRLSVQTTEDYSFPATVHTKSNAMHIVRHISFTAEKDVEYTIYRRILVMTNLEYENWNSVEAYDVEKQKHMAVWKKIWAVSRVEIDGDEKAELALNYSIYHLNCIAPRKGQNFSIPARGLSGQVYKGAVFWDTEMFMLDYYLFTDPAVARRLLMYRIETLPGALRKARSYGYDGAFYAWESQEGGYDACSDFNVVDVFTQRPMRTYFKDKQVHISAAVVYALVKYVQITGDVSILDEGGGEVIGACARFYRSLLIKRLDSDYYEIQDVIGPDEYHERVNNNAYTNAMARFVFRAAEDYRLYLPADTPDFRSLEEKLYMPQPNPHGVIEQFDHYFSLEDCSVADVRARLLNPKEYWGGANGVASHTQVIKQADVVAMLCMFREAYPKSVLKANLAYYEPKTEHGSSLSACMYSLLSCYVGDPDYAYPFFMKSASADLTKGGKEWAGLLYIGGTHPAAAGGAWKVAMGGFAGLEIQDNKLKFHPRLPKNWRKMQFHILYRNRLYNVIITKDECSVEDLELHQEADKK